MEKVRFTLYLKCPICKRDFQQGFKNRDYEGTVQCRNCGKTLFVRILEGYLVQEVRPFKFSISISSKIPKEVRSDLDEAMNCFGVDCYKASVVMCRRTLESAMDMIGISGNTLAEKLQGSFRKGLMDNATYNACSGIRLFGNYGAHPKNDLLKQVDEFEAELVLKISSRVLSEIFSNKVVKGKENKV